MKLLLFDQNLSPRLVDRLADLYPGSVHVSTVGLSTAFDREVWEYARQHDYRPVDFGAQWELRFGPDNRFRVFYSIDYEIMQVNILAIGEKRGERLILGGEVVRL